MGLSRVTPTNREPSSGTAHTRSWRSSGSRTPSSWICATAAPPKSIWRWT